jgi:hypothetical protein
MPPELHLHPDRLLAHAATAASLSEELRAALHDPPALDVGLVAEHERLRAAVGAAVRELAELSAVLAGAASAATAADAAALGHFRAVLGRDWS